MSLPDAVRVRISAESVETVSISPAVSQLMRMDELAAMVLAVSGKDPARVRDIFERGSLVSGTSRFRWDAVMLDERETARLLGRFPDPDPARPFNAGMCTAVVLHGLQRTLTIEREHGEKRRMFRRESFWDRMMALGSASAEYETYSFRDRADVYVAELSAAGVGVIAEAAKLLAVPGYEEQIRRGRVSRVEFLVPRRANA